MELKKHLDLRYLFVGLYVLLFVSYFIIGLQPADAASYNVTAKLVIPAIGLGTDVTRLELHDGKLDTPDTIVGSFTRAENKTLLIGHSTTIFNHLDSVQNGDMIDYDGRTYLVTSKEVLAKSDVSMLQVLKSESHDTLVLMTCAGELLGDGDATHRLIITAIKY